MSQVIAAPPVAAAPQPHGALAKDALGLPAVLFCIVTGAAPLAAMMFNVPVAVSGGGYAVPAAFLVATIALTIFSTGYIEMSQRVTSTGGFYTFISRGLGNVMGLGSGILIALCYVIFAAAVTGVLGYFASTTVDDWFGLSMPGLRLHVRRAGADDRLRVVPHRADGPHPRRRARRRGARAAGDVHRDHRHGGGPDGYSAAPLNPANLFDNDAALKVFGAAAAGVAIFGAFWSWVGFEMAPNYAEESRDPHKIAKAATYGSRDRPRALLHLRLVHVRDRLGPDRLGPGRRRPVRGQVRLGVLSADRQVRGRRADDDPAAADRHQLLRVRDGLLQHRRALPVRARPRGRPAEGARPHARQAPRPGRRGDGRHQRSSASTCSAS